MRRLAQQAFDEKYQELLTDVQRLGEKLRSRTISTTEFVARFEELIARGEALDAPDKRWGRLAEETVEHLRSQLNRYRLAVSDRGLSETELDVGDDEVDRLLAQYDDLHGS